MLTHITSLPYYCSVVFTSFICIYSERQLMKTLRYCTHYSLFIKWVTERKENYMETENNRLKKTSFYNTLHTVFQRQHSKIRDSKMSSAELKQGKHFSNESFKE